VRKQIAYRNQRFVLRGSHRSRPEMLPAGFSLTPHAGGAMMAPTLPAAGGSRSCARLTGAGTS
jgi:hypothetical protein